MISDVDMRSSNDSSEMILRNVSLKEEKISFESRYLLVLNELLNKQEKRIESLEEELRQERGKKMSFNIVM
jgi:hypothetical protein